MRASHTFRTGDELETLKSDLRSLKDDLQELGHDVGTLTSRLASEWRRRAPVGGWLSRAQDWRRSADASETWSGLRSQGQRSAEVLRDTVQARPLTVVLGALVIGYAIACLTSRRSADQ